MSHWRGPGGPSSPLAQRAGRRLDPTAHLGIGGQAAVPPCGTSLFRGLAQIQDDHETDDMFIETVPEDAAEGALADYYRQQRAGWGFLPNYAAAFSTRPDVASAWHALNTTIRDRMDRRRFEIATIAAARVLRSTYCTAAHSKFLRDVCGDDVAMRSIAADPSGAGLNREDRAVYEFAAKVAADAASVEQSDVDQLRSAGLTDADIADVVFAAAARSFFTRVLDGLGAQLDLQTAEAFPAPLRDAMIVGRPVAPD
jgi:uncharacterized peroxidase-related enzyme